MGAAYAAWLKFGDDAYYYPMSYNEPLPAKLEETMYLLDFSLPRNDMLRLRKMIPHLVCLDHHKTAKEALEGLDFCVFDMNKSGARLAWEYFHPNTPVPLVIQYIEDRDLWRWALPDSHLVNARIMSFTPDFESIARMHKTLEENGIETVKAEGKIVEQAKARYIDAVSDFATVIELPQVFGVFAGSKAVLVNAPYVNISDLLHSLCEKFHMPAIGFFRRADGIWQYSFRSTDNMDDVSAWAKTIGGGGHRNASGAESNQLLF